MRKLIILGLMAATTVPAAASAQSRAEIRRDRQDVREARRDLQDARRELREDRRDRRAYVAPYRGWTYRPVAAGYQLRPAFYGQRYVIANPVQYRLRPAARNQRWVRYGNDLLLVNARNGRVLQVVRGRY